MQPFSLIAVGIGAVIALCPIETVTAQTPSSPRLSERTSSSDSVDLAQQPSGDPPSDTSSESDSPPAAVEPSSAPATPEAATPEATPTPQPATETPETPDSGDQTDSADSPGSSDPASDESPESEAQPELTPPEPENTASPAASETAPPAADTADTADDRPDPSETTPATPDSDANPTPAPSSATAADNATTLAPTYLDSDPNPLLTPTQPEEVQVIGTQPITLEQALELAQRNSQQLQVSQEQVNRARAALRQAEAANFPTLGVGVGTTSQVVDQVGQTQFNPQTGGFESGNTTTEINTTLTGTVELNYDVFTSGARSARIQASQRQVRFQELQFETVAEDLRLNVTRDYYSVQDADEQVRIAQSALEQSLRSLQDTQAQLDAGIGTRFDVLQSQVQVANDQQELTQRLSQQRINRRQLVQRLNLAESIEISAAESVEVADLWNLTLEDSIVLAYRNRAELEQQLLQREIGDLQRRANLAQLEPQVSVTGSYNVQNTLDSDQGFDDTFQVGAQVNLTLFDGGASRSAAQQEEANIAIAEAQFADLRSQVRFQVEQAYYNLRANFENIDTASLAQEQATESLRLARLRFQAGVGIQSDVLRAQTELTQAEVNRVGAILGYNRSLAELQRAVSNSLNGNLADVP